MTIQENSLQINASARIAHSDPQTTIVVLGGGYAGVMAANRIAGRVGPEVRVVLINESAEFIHRVRLHEMAAGTRTQRHQLAELLHSRVEGIEGRVTRIHGSESKIEMRGGQTLAYDQCILAIGSEIAEAIPGAREYGGALAHVDAALAFAKKLATLPAGSPVVVLGMGLSGIEVASEIAEAHPNLRVVLVGETFAPGWPEPVQVQAQRQLADLGVTLRCGARARELTNDAVILENGERLPAAAAIWVGGFRCPSLARESGLPVDALGRVRVDETLRVVGYSNIVAAGDIAAAPLTCMGTGISPMRMACATAMPMGAHAADVVVDLLRGKTPLRFRYRNTGQCVSLGRRKGMVVFIDQDDQPTGRVLGGLRGALVKELICRLVIGALRIERSLPGMYAWLGRGERRRLDETGDVPKLTEERAV